VFITFYGFRVIKTPGSLGNPARVEADDLAPLDLQDRTTGAVQALVADLHDRLPQLGMDVAMVHERRLDADVVVDRPMGRDGHQLLARRQRVEGVDAALVHEAAVGRPGHVLVQDDGAADIGLDEHEIAAHVHVVVRLRGSGTDDEGHGQGERHEHAHEEDSLHSSSDCGALPVLKCAPFTPQNFFVC